MPVTQPAADLFASDEQKRVALDYITEAWIEAVKDGVEPEGVALAAFEASLRELVALRGEDHVAGLLTDTAPRVTAGAFTPFLTRQ